MTLILSVLFLVLGGALLFLGPAIQSAYTRSLQRAPRTALRDMLIAYGGSPQNLMWIRLTGVACLAASGVLLLAWMKGTK